MIQVSFQYVLTGFVSGVFFVEQVVQPVVGKVGVLIQYPIYALVIFEQDGHLDACPLHNIRKGDLSQTFFTCQLADGIKYTRFEFGTGAAVAFFLWFFHVDFYYCTQK